MNKILPVFKDDRDKIIIVAMLVSSMFFVFIPALIVILFLKDYISESSYEITKSLLNLELFLFLISLFFAIPLIGWLLGLICLPLIEIFNIILVVINLCAVTKGSEVKIPVPYAFI